MHRVLIGMAFIIACRGAWSQELEQGTPDCSQEAVDAAITGARSGDAAAIYKMARHYSTGACIPRDGRTAIALYQLAAEQGYAPAFYNLGVIAAANKDYRTAEALFHRGAQLGHRGCELHLGILYSFSSSIPEVGDDAKAFAWLSLAAARAGKTAMEAKAILEDVAKQLRPEDQERGERILQQLERTYRAVPEFRP